MSDFVSHVEHHTCWCTHCVLVRCVAVEADWPAWREVELEVDMKGAMVRLTRCEPMIWPQPGAWVGERAWFDLFGIGLQFGGPD